MKPFISFILFLSLASLTGCSFLKAGTESEDPEETAYSEEISEEEGEDFQEDAETADEEDEYSEDEEDFDDSDTAEEEGDDEDLEEEEQEGGKKKGFLAKLFSWGEDSEASDEEEDFQEEDDFEGEDDLDEYSEDETEESMEDDFTESSEDETETTSSESDSVTTEDSKPQEQTSTPAETPTETSTQSDMSSSSVTDTSATESPTQTKLVSVKKIKTRTYRKGAYLVNAVYIARSGDTIESVSQKIYNTNQQEVLYTINPHFQSKALKIGDKVYYNSPHRPQDSSRILIYYEELGIPSQTHMISAGQNIRSVSRNLLGHKDSWKELWATNPNILSKSIVSESQELRYWPKDASVPEPQVEIQEEPAAVDQPQEIGEKQEGSEETPSALDDKTAEEPPSDQQPSEPIAMSENRKKGLNIGQIFLIGAFAVAILFSLLMVFKKRRKKQEFDYTATNIKPPS